MNDSRLCDRECWVCRTTHRGEIHTLRIYTAPPPTSHIFCGYEHHNSSCSSRMCVLRAPEFCEIFKRTRIRRRECCVFFISSHHTFPPIHSSNINPYSIIHTRAERTNCTQYSEWIFLRLQSRKKKNLRHLRIYMYCLVRACGGGTTSTSARAMCVLHGRAYMRMPKQMYTHCTTVKYVPFRGAVRRRCVTLRFIK